MKLDAIILGGGRSKRMGENKALVRVGPTSLLANVALSLADAQHLAIVAPASVVEDAFRGAQESELRPGQVIQTLEDPPFGGPVAGIAAGVTALSQTPYPARNVAIFACDLPGASLGFSRLREHTEALGESIDGVCAIDPNGRKQWLMGIYSRDFLTNRLAELGEARAASVREFVRPARLRLVKMPLDATSDLDGPEDVALYRAGLVT